MKEGHIFIDGEINEEMMHYVSEQIALNRGAEKLIIHMHSPGGSVYQGYNIYHKLRSISIPKECVIEGSCMSIASFIAMACDKVVALNPSRYMIHLPLMGLEGTREDLMNGARELEIIENEIVDAYHSKTKLPKDQLMQMMKKETYMGATEAKTFGFVDEVREPLKAVAYGKRSPMTKDKSIFDNLGQRISAMMMEIFGPKAMDIQTDKGMLHIESEDANITGKPATIGGQPAPDGEYQLDDGKVISVSGGMVTEVKDGKTPPPPPESAEDKLKKMESDLAALRAENESLRSAAATATQAQETLNTVNAELETVKAQNVKAREAMASFQKEIDDLKSKTVGDEGAPKGPSAHKKKINEPSAVVDETDAFLAEFAPHILDIRNEFNSKRKN